MNELIYKLKLQIIWELHLEDIGAEDIDNNEPLFGEEGLGLDSLDVLELCWLLQKYYGITLKDCSQVDEVFKSVTVMADYIQKNRTK